MNYQDRISIEPGKRGGKPCIRGMRMTVYDVLDYLASGMSEQEILNDFISLTWTDRRLRVNRRIGAAAGETRRHAVKSVASESQTPKTGSDSRTVRLRSLKTTE